MTAQHLVEMYRDSLVGKWVTTEAIGEYPGGVAQVTEIAPDPAAPEIVFNVDLPGYGPMGIFEMERSEIVEAPEEAA
jgi:hypothetical protein